MTKRRKNAGTDGENGAATMDIPHEEVHSPPESTPVTAVVETVDDQIKHELAKFNPADAGIAKLKEMYGALEIKGRDDKAGYNTVKKAWNEVRSTRTALEKKGLELRSGYGVITKAIKKEEDRLVELITPLENDLNAKWKAIDDEKERVKREQEEAEGRRLMARINELVGLGMTLQDGFYQIGETITVDVASLRSLSDDTYEKLRVAVKNKADEIQKAQELEAERKRQEQAELQRQQEQLKQQQEQLAEQQRQLQEQKAEMARQLRDLRLGKLQGIGLELSDNGDVVRYESVRLYLAPLIEMTAEEFNRTLDITAGQIKELKNKKAQEEEEKQKAAAEKDRREKLIAKNLEAIGMTFDFAGQMFRFKTPDTEAITAQFGHFGDMDDAAIMNVCVHLGTRIEKSKADQKKIDDDRETERKKQEKLGLSDKQRWDVEMEQMSVHVLRIVPGEYKTDKYQKKAQTFLDRLTNLITEYKS